MNRPTFVNFGIRLTAILAIVALIAGQTTLRASAARATNSYESETYGISVTWDDEVWTASPADLGDGGEGVALDSLVSFGQIQGVNVVDDSGQACLDRVSGYFKDDEGGEVEKFRVASKKFERPEALEGTTSELYSYTFLGGEAPFKTIMFLQCSELPNGAGSLLVFLSTQQEIYPDVIEDWNNLIGGISFTSDNAASGKSGKTGKSSSKATTGIDGDHYSNADQGFSLGWNTDFWTPAEIEDGDGVELDADSSYAYISAVSGDKVADADACLTALGDNLSANETVIRLRAASKSLDRPETARKASGKLYTFTNASNDTKMVAYLECRPLAGAGYLTLQFLTIASAYADELPEWQTVIDSIEIGAVDAKSGTDEGSTESTKSTEKEPVEGATTAGPNYGVEITYDDTVWEATDYSDDSIDQIGFSSSAGIVNVITVSGRVDLAGCVQTLADSEAKYAIDGISTASRKYDRPSTSKGVEAELYTLSIDGSDGPIDALYYVECRELPSGDGMVAVTFTTVERIWDDARPVIEQLLSGIAA